jgi:hypothetical protein
MKRLSDRNVVSRLRIIVVLAVAVCALVACSAVRFGYNQAPELVYWWLDGYADFDDAQSRRVRELVAEWFAWHRRTQLPDYARLLARAQAEALADTTPERACGWWNTLRERGELAMTQALPAAAELMPALSTTQLAHVQHRQAKSNEDFRNEYLAADAPQRLKDSVRRTIERAEILYGRLDDAQRERVAKLVAASPFDPELWLAERKERQREALQMMRHFVEDPPGREAALTTLKIYVDRLMRSPREGYRRYDDKLTLYNCAFAASLHNSTSPAQRQAAAAKLKNWEIDLRALAADAK